jgi:opacity protein-like surface antigen
MSQKTIAISLALFGAASVAHAEGLNGAYIGGGLGLYKGDMKVSSRASGDFTLGDSGHKASLDLYGGYGHTFDGGFHLAGEVGYADKIGHTSANIVGVGSFNSELKHAWTFSVLTGYAFSKDTVAYFREGYATAKGSPTLGTDQSFHGMVYGFGVRQVLAKNVSARLEYQMFEMKAKDVGGSNVKPTSGGLLLGVSYTF